MEYQYIGKKEGKTYEEFLKLKKTIEILEENNNLLIKQKDQMYKDLDILSNRIDKAIEYVEENIISFKDREDIEKELLEILKGDE